MIRKTEDQIYKVMDAIRPDDNELAEYDHAAYLKEQELIWRDIPANQSKVWNESRSHREFVRRYQACLRTTVPTWEI